MYNARRDHMYNPPRSYVQYAEIICAIRREHLYHSDVPRGICTTQGICTTLYHGASVPLRCTTGHLYHSASQCVGHAINWFLNVKPVGEDSTLKPVTNMKLWPLQMSLSPPDQLFASYFPTLNRNWHNQKSDWQSHARSDWVTTIVVAIYVCTLQFHLLISMIKFINWTHKRVYV